MIINHSKKFIFFANRKTASTSTAIALSSSCNHNDVITPLGRDEKIRKELGYQGPTNFIPWWNKLNYFAIKAKCKLQKKGVSRYLKSIGLHTHIEATTALSKNYISTSIFESYYSFCFIRNPWDQALSHFFLNSKKTRDCRPSTWTPSSKAECSKSSQGHADRSTATKEIFWSNIYIDTKTYRKQLRAFSATSA